MTAPPRHFHARTHTQQRQVLRRIDDIERVMLPACFDPQAVSNQQFGTLLTAPDRVCTFGDCQGDPQCREQCPNKRSLPAAQATASTACPARLQPMPKLGTDWIAVAQVAAAAAFICFIALAIARGVQ